MSGSRQTGLLARTLPCHDLEEGGLRLDVTALDRLMPLSLVVGRDGTIWRAAPLLRKLRPGIDFAGQGLFELFELRRPRGREDVSQLLATDSGHLSLAFRAGTRSHFKGIVVPLPCGTGALFNLSFGISVVEAVQAYDLTLSDFAATDLAVEMLYLVEAKSAAFAESKKLNQRLQGAKVAAEEQAFTDTLTGLKNRRALDHVLGRFMANGVPFGLMHLDLDFFKQVNDTYGHAAGDEVLQAVARILVSETRGNDMVARVGGDEFVLIFQTLVDLEKLTAIARRVIERLEEPVPFGSEVCRISGSIGIVTTLLCPDIGIAGLLRAADTALYASKRAGRRMVTVFDDTMTADTGDG